MDRRHLLLGMFACGAMGVAPARAATLEERVIAQLRAQGFGNIRSSRTLLGRIRITAQSATLRREIILNPTTGIILRDLWWPIGDADPDGQIFDPSEGEGNLPGHDDDDDDDDDEDDDDDDDDDGADDD